jgi:lysyl-tRNA synthetase class 2
VCGAAAFLRGGRSVDTAAEWLVLTVSEAFQRFAQWDPARAWDAERFNLDLVERVEPALPADRPAVLIDFPAEVAALARCRPGDPPVAERWELYIGGVELANAYTELTDAVEQRRRFEQCAAARRARGAESYAPDEDFLAALARGMPPCGGVALGVDRLLMLLTGAASMDEVLPFS